MPPKQAVIAITSGEPAGVGPDIIANLQADQFDARLVIIGDRDMLASRARALASKLSFTDYKQHENTIESGAIEVLTIPLRHPCKAGELDVNNAAYVLKMLERACNGCLQGEFTAMVTAPIQKDIINQSGIAFTGHTEFLAQICRVEKPVMLLAAEKLRVALVTTHLPLRDVADHISFDSIIQTTSILDHDLRLRFGLANPHIKVCGLNPHAGENGYLGREEIEIITPAIKQLRERGMNISGPYPADTVFTPQALSDTDAVLAMYHDQGLPVLKHAGFHRAINTTLGLPIIRTSVDHGTALDIAGTNKADAGSMLAAIESAIYQSNCKNNATST